MTSNQSLRGPSREQLLRPSAQPVSGRQIRLSDVDKWVCIVPPGTPVVPPVRAQQACPPQVIGRRAPSPTISTAESGNNNRWRRRLLLGSGLAIATGLLATLAFVMSPSDDDEPQDEAVAAAAPEVTADQDVIERVRREANAIHRPSPQSGQARSPVRDGFNRSAYNGSPVSRWIKDRKRDLHATFRRATPAAIPSLGPDLHKAITLAASAEGLPPELMIRLVGKESGGSSRATSDTGAAGSCQMTEQTFYRKLAQDGPRKGFGHYADAVYSYVSKNDGKTYFTAGKQSGEILALRHKNDIALPLCASLIRSDLQHVQSRISRPVTFADAATAHFMGADVASNIINAYLNPKTRNDSAYKYVNEVNYKGATNRSIFFKDGNAQKPYTVAQVYEAKVRVMTDKPVFDSRVAALGPKAP